MAAISFLVHLDPKEAARQLKQRLRELDAEIEQRTTGLAAASAHVQRINLIESEYLLAMLHAERTWTSSIEKEIRKGKLTWNLKAILREAAVSRKEASQRRK